MQGHTIWEMSRMHSQDLLLQAEPTRRRRRPRPGRVRRAVGTRLVRAGARLMGTA